MATKLKKWAKRRAGKEGLQAVQVEVHGEHGTHMATRYKRAAEAYNEAMDKSDKAWKTKKPEDHEAAMKAHYNAAKNALIPSGKEYHEKIAERHMMQIPHMAIQRDVAREKKIEKGLDPNTGLRPRRS